MNRIEVTPQNVIRKKTKNWTIVTDDGLMEKLTEFRQSKLPNETGGVLLGAFDVARSILYIADALPSPPDSKE